VYEYLSQRVAPALASELDLLAARHRVPAFAKKHHPGGNNGTVRND
jgi:hypothetical protein